MSALAWLLALGSAGLLLAALLAAFMPGASRAQALTAWTSGASALLLAIAGGFATFGTEVHWEWFGGFGLGSGGFTADRLSGLFLLISCGVATPLLLAGSSGSLRPAARIPDALRPLLVLAVVGVFLADNVFVFLMLWEISALVIYALVAVRYQDEEASRAADLTLTLTKLGGAAVLAGFLLLAATAGSFSFAALTTLGPAQDAALRGVCFLLFFAGFGVKAAIVPMQTWLPRAYGQSTAESAGLLAAVALNLAFYGMLRTWFDLLGDPAVWWAVVALLAGSITALLGILGGILQGRLREFIAYSSIENAGIIVTALGIALMGAADHQSGLLGLGLVAATFQITAHSVAKAGLFTAAAAVERSAGTDDMDRLGGLYRVLPVASVGALFGAAALSALPPFSGFASEWMTFEGLMQGFRVGGTGAHLAMALAGALLALTAGLTALAFVRAIGITFLGLPREPELEPKPDRKIRSVAGGVLAAGSLAIGIAAPWVVEVLERGTADIGGAAAFGTVAKPGWLIEPGYPDFASISPTVLAILLAGFGVGFWVLRALLRARRRGRVVPVWASATELVPSREQYSAFGYANMSRVIFNVIYRIRPEVEAEGDERFPTRMTVIREKPKVFDPSWLYRPITRSFAWLADRVRGIQAGFLGLYLLYLLLALVALLLISPRV
jgi:formate hydrogenlyase subunit 3/multisubunit Na+/H+ antiporter MnhD subunit